MLIEGVARRGEDLRNDVGRLEDSQERVNLEPLAEDEHCSTTTLTVVVVPSR